METAKFIYTGNPDRSMTWKFIMDTVEERAKAIQEGYSAFSTMSFDYEPEKDKPEPTRYGSLWIDMDCKGDPKAAILAARSFIRVLEFYYGIDPACLRYFLSGGKGMHIEIPAEVFGGTAGHALLPQIHKTMIERALIPVRYNELYDEILEKLDMSLYCSGKGKLLRAPNVQRPKDGNCKVQISNTEFESADLDLLLQLVSFPRDVSGIHVAPPQECIMTELYDRAKDYVMLGSENRHFKDVSHAVLNFEFIQYCRNNQATLKEPLWSSMISVLSRCGKTGESLVHEFSRGHPEYTREKTDAKIRNVRSSMPHVTCNSIQKYYQCTRQCNVRSPLDIRSKNNSNREIAKKSFTIKTDGVYFSVSCGLEDDGVRICSPMKILGKMRNMEGQSWSRLVEFPAPDGQIKKVCVNMRDCTGRGDAVRALLSDHGLEISMAPKASTWLMEYIQHGGPEDVIYLQMDKVGWHNNTFVLPDAQFGEKMNETIYYDGSTDNLHKEFGTLSGRQKQVGRFCQGNSLLVLSCSYALTGPLLNLCGMEGGGLHVHCASSTGKTTCALVAGSVCGGGGNRGYLRQWRSTHNALESTAAMHNDNLLVLDEVGQATAEVVSQVAYMLPNGQGRERMRADTSRRKAFTWRLNFFSTGELTINDKIEETGKIRTMAGQGVRVIDLPVDGGTGRNLFENLHGHANAAEMSTALTSSCIVSYGTPLRAFLEHLCQDLNANTDRVREIVYSFVSTAASSDASGQVKRVANKFGLIAAAGELAIEWGIFPLQKGDALAAASEWFKIWIEQRGGHGDMEIARVIKRIQDHFATEQSRYVNVDVPLHYPVTRQAGYTWQRNRPHHYLMLSPVFDEMIRGVNRKVLLRELDKSGCLAHTASGGLMETKSVNGSNVRGIVFIPAAWEGEAQMSVQTTMPMPVPLPIESLDLNGPSFDIFS